MERQTDSLRRDLGTSLTRARAEVLGRFADVVDFDDSSVPARRSRAPFSAPLAPLAAGPAAETDDERLAHDRF